jgi:putative chitinase
MTGQGSVPTVGRYRFRGRGLIQFTGRDEYSAFGRAIGKTPEQAADYCETNEGAAFSGCWYLASNGCLPLADAWDIDAITRRVNGDAMEAAGLRRQYSDEMVSRLREYSAGA